MSETLIGQIPEHWETLSLGELCARGDGDIQTGPFGSQLHASDYVRVGIPSVMPQNIGDNVIIEDSIARISPEDAKRLNRYLLAPGDIVYSRRGDVERRALVRPEQSGWLCGTGCLRVRPGTGADSRFLSYYLSHPEVRSYIVRHAIGATMSNLNTQILSAVPVVLPPRPMQQAIAVTLGALDDKIGVNERIAVAALKLGTLCYERSFINSSDMSEFRLGDVVDIFDGPHATPTKTIDGPWFLSISSLKRGYLDLSESAHISDEDFTRWTRRVTPREGDLLFSYETRLGEAALMPPGIRGCLGRRMALMRPRQSRVDSIFLLYSYLRTEFQETIRRRAIHGATVDRIPLAELPSWRIRILDSDQHRTLANLLSALHNKMVLSQRENDTLRELRDTLLPKLLAGKLRIKDAEKMVEKAV